MTDRPTAIAVLGRRVLAIVLGSWFVATLVSQDPTRRHAGARRLDPTGLFIADWRFFSPLPGTTDTHLLVRDELADGALSAWAEVAQVSTRRPQHILFYANRRGEKALTDAMSSLVRLSEDDAVRDNPNTMTVSLPYLAILNFVSHQVDHQGGAVKTQFALARSAGYDEVEQPETVFLSERHGL